MTLYKPSTKYEYEGVTGNLYSIAALMRQQRCDKSVETGSMLTHICATHQKCERLTRSRDEIPHRKTDRFFGWSVSQFVNAHSDGYGRERPVYFYLRDREEMEMRERRRTDQECGYSSGPGRER
jgi:hypothetical protein